MVHLSKYRYPIYTSTTNSQPRNLRSFPIKKKLGENTYIIDLSNDLEVFKTFNVKDIFDYHPTNNANVKKVNSE